MSELKLPIDVETGSQKYDLDSNSDPDKIGKVQNTQVKRGLKERHVTMIALGGAIGTGLFINLSTPLAIAGPVNAFFAFLCMATLAYSVTQSIGEMATYIPVASSFTVFSKRFVSPAAGVAVGYLYWFSWVITFALELSIVGQVIQYWTDAVPLAAWIAIFWVILTALNFFPVKFYGEIEFWVAFVKVVAIVGFILYAFIMVCGAGVTGPVGFRYWRHPGPWGPGYLFEGTSKGRFCGWVSSLINAAFTFQGIELAGVSAGESKNPRKSVPRAINTVFIRVTLFYLLPLLLIGLLVPYNDPKLSSTETFVSASPFIIAIQNSGTKVLPDIFNAVILMTIISAGNSNVYISSRILYGLAQSKLSLSIFSITSKNGVPYYSVLFSASFGLLGFMAVSSGSLTVFNWFVNITAVAGLFTWMFVSISHIRFMAALKYQGISRDSLPFKAALMPGLAYYSAAFVTVLIIINGYEAFVGGFHVNSFFTAYISVILFVVVWAVAQAYYWKGGLWRDVQDIDIDSDRREADAIVWEDEPDKKWYQKVLGIFF